MSIEHPTLEQMAALLPDDDGTNGAYSPSAVAAAVTRWLDGRLRPHNAYWVTVSADGSTEFDGGAGFTALMAATVAGTTALKVRAAARGLKGELIGTQTYFERVLIELKKTLRVGLQ